MLRNFYILNCDGHGRAFADKLIAFFPEDGFVIYEGYTYAKKSQLPHKLELLRFAGNDTKYIAHFDVTVTDFYKKFLDFKIMEKCDCAPDDDCVCNVMFQARDIIILKFKVDNVYDKVPAGYDWRVCIDHRYETPEELLASYMELVELPEESFGEVILNPDHKEFYKGYYEMTDKDEDLFQSDRNFPRFL